jgi:hypothetical protein
MLSKNESMLYLEIESLKLKLSQLKEATAEKMKVYNEEVNIFITQHSFVSPKCWMFY